MVKKFHPREVSFTMPQENFAEYYSFDKTNTPSPRQRLAGVDKYAMKYCMDDEYRPKEAKYLRGNPSGYGHSATQRRGSERLSGKAGAHRIGKR